jgi:hypothetical protein
MQVHCVLAMTGFPASNIWTDLCLIVIVASAQDRLLADKDELNRKCIAMAEAMKVGHGRCCTLQHQDC